jgi:N-acetylglucosaminyldiphosphoundecaprenol N-acetyl-beta-D-mannosaminyltransferase
VDTEATAGSSFTRISFLGVSLATCTTNEFIEWLTGPGLKHHSSTPALVTYMNAWCADVAQHDSQYRNILNSADCVYADGQAIVWAGKMLGFNIQERVNAADFILKFCDSAGKRGLSLYLLGSAPGVAARAAQFLGESVPGLKIAGYENGYFENEDEIVRKINDAQPDIILLGLGVPLQEKWASRNRNRLHVRAIWCVGALFEYYGQARLRAPVCLRKAGLEWAFRLALEPRRLWRRYLLGNVEFVARVVWARLGTRRGS